MPDSLLSGSAAWTDGQEYEDEYADRIKQFNDKVNQNAVLSYASSLRGGQTCTISREFSVGDSNLVRKIRFDDAVEWIVRLRMPLIPEHGSSGTLSSPAREKVLLDMQSELTTMEFVRRNTDIPIPRVYGYDLNDQNAVGCPFSIIEYVDGHTAEEVSRTYPGEHEGIPAQFEEKFWRQLAKIMSQLASIRLPKIGSIVRDSSGSFVVGPLVETGSGPYDSTTEFYADYPLALSKSLGEQPVSGQDELIQAFQSFAASFTPPAARVGDGSAEGFGLANQDLNPNNVLVDREFNVLAVIDWDAVVSLPDAVLHRFPFMMGVRCAVPGVVDTHPETMRRVQLGRRFVEVVEAVGREQAEIDREGANKWPTRLLTKSGFYSKEAVAFRSLIYAKMRQDWVNNTWVQGLKWLSEHDEVQVETFYLGGKDAMAGSA